MYTFLPGLFWIDEVSVVFDQVGVDGFTRPEIDLEIQTIWFLVVIK